MIKPEVVKKGSVEVQTSGGQGVNMDYSVIDTPDTTEKSGDLMNGFITVRGWRIEF